MTLSACIEPFTAETQTFENALVVDALLTNELRRHTVKLSRTYTFESEGPIAESNAQVQISDDMGSSYLFRETDSGIYTAIEIFSAIPGRSYILDITTSDGKSYISESVIAPKNVLITDLFAERVTNDLGEEGVSIRLDNETDTDASEPTFFRYEYEETYKIIAPKYDPFKFEVIDYTPCDGNFYEVGIKPRTEEQRVCYASRKSVGIKQATTISLTGNELSNFLVRFINREDYILSHRYSILVRQYAQTRNAYSYYESLNDFSSTESIFSDTQPGFLFGNIFSRNDLEEKVLGYFEVSSVSEQRIYFNYVDLFPNEELPPYAVNCDIIGNPELVGRGYHCDGNVCDGACESPLIEAILAGIVVFHSENENISREMPGPYFTLPSPCGDCTKLGSNIVPDFWEEKRI
tara:strand:- start:7560 stop:8780 length:1221 start_codon:yes stop_codon:yes gene_type:complete